jgi:hypothetical protein
MDYEGESGLPRMLKLEESPDIVHPLRDGSLPWGRSSGNESIDCVA